MTSDRLDALQRWLGDELRLAAPRLVPASSDASFRRYFRVLRDDAPSLIAMDSPPERENNARFVDLSRALHPLGVNVPKVLEADMKRGFLLLDDLGDTTFLQVIGPSNADRLYGDALGALTALQACGPVDSDLVPPYDARRLLTEMALFKDWYLQAHLGLELGSEAEALLEDTFATLAASALEQPRVFVHRDYHSRNLMLHAKQNPGILDFQDAVTGPVTYDLVSLLRDCYVAWPEEQVRDWALGYRELALQSGILREDDEDRFLRWLDLMGIQRHLKAIGIFARLLLRDGKPNYIGDIPRTMKYVLQVGARYPELSAFHAWLQRYVVTRDLS
jgi:aminoglycoside/choline kinase family phosphotransferase